jgi:hypothetical protein
MSTRRSTLTSLVGVTALVATLALAGCSGSDGDSGSDSGSDSGVAAGGSSADEQAQGDGAQERAAADSASGYVSDSAGGGQSAEPAALTDVQLGQHLVKTGSVDMESDDIQKVVDRVYALASTTGGSVTAESTTTGAGDALDHARLEVRVPVATFDRTLDRIESLGTNAENNTETADVTGKVANVDSRVRSAEQSIRQLQLLFDQATTLGQVITLERELSRRQADLEALEAQQRALRSQTTMSTIVVTVRLTEKAEKPPADDESQDGFVAGVKQGWDGFVTFVVGAGHALGLVLPFALLVLALGGVGWVAHRRFQHGKGSGPLQPTGTSSD